MVICLISIDSIMIFFGDDDAHKITDRAIDDDAWCIIREHRPK